MWLVYVVLEKPSQSCCPADHRFKDSLVNTVGHRHAEMGLELGLLYSPSEALRIGLVDQLVPEDQVLSTATQTMTKWLAIPGTQIIPQWFA